MEEKIRARLSAAITDHVFPGAIVGMVDRAGLRLVVPVGRQTYADDAPLITADTIYDVASITKAIPVSSLALHLIEHGRLTLDQKIISLIPELRTTYRETITLRHLLTQTLPFATPLSSLRALPAEALLEAILTTEFSSPPGKKLNYANATSILLGIVIERVTKKPLDTLADEVLFGPLEMTRTTFHPQAFPLREIVPTEVDPFRGIVHGIVHDESASRLQEIMIPGSAGVFSTVPDLLNFLQMLLHDGTYRERHFFSPDLIKQMATDQLEGGNDVTGLGWELQQRRYIGNACSDMTIGKTGFTGCVVICDIKKGRGMVLLSNYQYPKRRASVVPLDSVRRDIADIVFTVV